MSAFVIRVEFLEPVNLLGIPKLTVGSAWPNGTQVASAAQVDELNIDFTMASGLTSSEVVYLPSWDQGLRGPNGEWISGFQVQVTNVGPINQQMVMESPPANGLTSYVIVTFAEDVIINATPTNWSVFTPSSSDVYCDSATAIGTNAVELGFSAATLTPETILRVPLNDQAITNAAGWPLAGGIFQTVVVV